MPDQLKPLIDPEVLRSTDPMVILKAICVKWPFVNTPSVRLPLAIDALTKVVRALAARNAELEGTNRYRISQPAEKEE